MGAIVDAVFGGSAKDAAREQTAATRQAMEEYKKGVAEAKKEIFPRFDEASEKRLERTQQAMDVMGQGFTPSLDALSQGNMSAQQMLAGSMPQMQNAILGGPVDYGFMQPQGIDFDPSSFLAGMPQVFDPTKPQAGDAVPQQPNVPSFGPTFGRVNEIDMFSGGSGGNPMTNTGANFSNNFFGMAPADETVLRNQISGMNNPYYNAGGGGFSAGGAGGGGSMPSFQNWEKLR